MRKLCRYGFSRHGISLIKSLPTERASLIQTSNPHAYDRLDPPSITRSLRHVTLGIAPATVSERTLPYTAHSYCGLNYLRSLGTLPLRGERFVTQAY